MRDQTDGPGVWLPMGDDMQPRRSYAGLPRKFRHEVVEFTPQGWIDVTFFELGEEPFAPDLRDQHHGAEDCSSNEETIGTSHHKGRDIEGADQD